MKLTMDSGNFAFAIEGDLSPEAHDDLLAKGLKYETERGVLSNVYKDLAGVPGKKEGTKKLPDDFERKNVEFNEDNALAFEAALEKQLTKLFVAGSLKLSVKQYIAPESESGVKKATALYDAAKAANQLEALASHATIQYSGDVQDAEKFIAHIHAVKYAKVDAAAELAKLGLA